VKAEHLELSKVKNAELDFMKRTRNKEEYRRTSAIKQKLEGLSYRTIARNHDVNYRNVYNWIKGYKEYGLDGIRSKRNNAGRIPKISSDKNKQLIKEIIS
jgi:transposase